MKKLFAALILILCVFMLSACFSGEEPPKTDGPDSSNGSGDNGHKHTEVDIPAVPAACTEFGLNAGKKCSECGEITVEQTVIEALGHNFDDDGVCSRGDYTPTPGLSYVLETTGTNYYVSSIGSATSAEDIIVASYYKGKPVTRIKQMAFYFRDSIKSVYLPDTVTNIGQMAFDSCRNLESVRVSSNLNYIGSSVFGMCYNLEKTEKDGIAYLGNETNPYVVLIEITDKSFKRVVLPDGVKVIATSAFQAYSTLNEVILPEGLKGISNAAFLNCSSLEKINLPESLELLGETAFKLCEKLEEIVIPNGVGYINQGTFGHCCSLKKVTFGSGLKSIDRNAFRECSSLESIIIPEGVTEINGAAFYGCINLKEAYLPGKLSAVNDGIFRLCENLKDIYFDGTAEEWNALEKSDWWDEGMASDYVIHCSDGDVTK